MEILGNVKVYANFNGESGKYRYSIGVFNSITSKKGKKEKVEKIATFPMVNFSKKLKEEIEEKFEDFINEEENYNFDIDITDGWLSCYKGKDENKLCIFINEGEILEDEEDEEDEEDKSKKSKGKSTEKSKGKTKK